MAFDYPDAAFIGSLLSELFLGAYITVFGLYVKILRVRSGRLMLTDYGLIAMFIMAVAFVVMDGVQQFYTLLREPQAWTAKINSASSVISATMDFISQSIIIYRCWSVWGHVLWVGLPPAFLAVASYALNLTLAIDLSTVSDSYEALSKSWWNPVGTAAFTISLIVNALVSALMIARILHVHRRSSSAVQTSIGRLSWVASILLESAIVLFVAQLVFLVLYKIEHPAFSLVVGPVTILYGLNCTAIMVRVGMNQTYETRVTTLQSTMAFKSSVKKGGSQLALNSEATAYNTSPSSEKGSYANLHYNVTESTVVHRV